MSELGLSHRNILKILHRQFHMSNVSSGRFLAFSCHSKSSIELKHQHWCWTFPISAKRMFLVDCLLPTNVEWLLPAPKHEEFTSFMLFFFLMTRTLLNWRHGSWSRQSSTIMAPRRWRRDGRLVSPMGWIHTKVSHYFPGKWLDANILKCKTSWPIS